MTYWKSLHTPICKIASFEIQDIPLITYAASQGKPMILSTGIAEIGDIELAIETCKKVGNSDITILKSVHRHILQTQKMQTYLTIPDIKKRFGVKAGLSDHAMGIEGPSCCNSIRGDRNRETFHP